MSFDLTAFLNQTYGRTGERMPPRPLPPSHEQAALAQMGLGDLSLRFNPDWPEDLREAHALLQSQFPWLFQKNPAGHIEARPVVTYRVRRQPKDKTGRKIKGTHPVDMVESRRVGLATLILIASGKLDLPVHRFKERVREAAQPLLDLGHAGADFVDLICTLAGGKLFAPDAMIESWATWLTRALSGESSTLVSLVCPDYEVVDGKYTFNALGDGVGLVAGRVIDTLSAWHAFAVKHQLPISFVICMADFEADSEATRERVGLTHEEFLARCHRSQQAMFASIHEAIPAINGSIRTPFFTEVIGGRRAWDTALEQARQCIARDDLTGAFPLDDAGMEMILRARGPMWQIWWPDLDPLDALKLQIVEYGAAGMSVFSGDVFPNALMLGGDSPFMSPFVQMGGDRVRPTVYLKAMDY